MITLTTEQAQQIEEALKLAIRTSYSEHNNIKFEASLATIRAARAQEQAEQEPAAKHWHDLYREKCQELHDERARLGAEIVALEQAEQEPVAYAGMLDGSVCAVYTQWPVSHYHKIKPLYDAPVRTKDLTDEEIVEVMETWGTAFMNLNPDTAPDPDVYIARAIIAADREKNK